MNSSPDDAEMSAVIQQYSGYVYQLAWRMLGNAQDARDVAQDTFIKLYQNWDKRIESSSLKNWICTIALNTSRDLYRKQKRLKLGNEKFLRDFDEPQDFTEDLPNKDLVQNVLNQLSLEFRMVIQLFYFEEKSIKEIAEILEISEVLVKVRLFRAKKHATKILSVKK